MTIEKEQIVRTAIRILDRDGLEGVTLRRIASELHIQAASIYWHLPDKEALLNEMANEILMERFGDYDFADDQRDWTQWLALFARELRAAMLAHREGARVVAGAHLHIAVMLTKLLDLSVRILHNSGFTYGKAAAITATVRDFCFGFAIEEQAMPHMDVALANQLSHLHQFPGIAAAMSSPEYEDHDTRFDTAIRMIVNGARSEL